MSTKLILIAVATIIGGVLGTIVREAYWTVATEAALDEFFTYMHWERSKMILAATPYFVMLGLCYLLYQRRERMTRGGSRIAKSLNR